MEPGAGGREQAQRHAERAARLATEHALEPTDDTRAAHERADRTARRWAAGAVGEVQVAGALGALDRYGWTALHDVRWPGRRQANLDHVALGPGGAVVVDAKNWTGQVDVHDGVLRQNGHLRTKEADAALAAAAAVTALLAPPHRTAVRAVLCLAGRDLAPTALADGVVVVGDAHLAEHLASMPPRLTPYDVADIGRQLSRELERPAARPATTRRPARASPPRLPAVRGPRRAPTRTARKPHPGVKVAKVLALLLGLWWVLQLLSGLFTDHVERLTTPAEVVPTVAVTTPAAGTTIGAG